MSKQLSFQTRMPCLYATRQKPHALVPEPSQGLGSGGFGLLGFWWVGFLVFLTLGWSMRGAATESSRDSVLEGFEPGSYLIKIDRDLPSWLRQFRADHPDISCEPLIQSHASLRRPLHAVVKRPLDAWVLVQLPDHGSGWSTARAMQELLSLEHVSHVEPNYLLQLDQVRLPDDFYFERSWGLNNMGQFEGKADADIDLPEAWMVGQGDRRVTVAVVDTGIDFFHPDLQGNLWTNVGEIPANGLDDDGNGLIDDWHGYDFVSDDGDPFDDQGHGTHVAGIIGAVADNRRGSAGVSPEVSLMAIKTFGTSGKADVATVMRGVRYAIDQGARILNASWGVDVRSEVMRLAVEEVHAAGLLFVAAGGNRKSDQLFYPAAFDHTIAVGATNQQDQRTRFSNYGDFIDLAAPGESIFSTFPDNRFGFLSGTSMAAPHVSGAAVLMLARHPEWSAEELQRALINSVDPIEPDKPLGLGRLNAHKAQLIDHPLPMADFSLPDRLGGLIGIRGSAYGEHFRRYRILLGYGQSPLEWSILYQSDEPVLDQWLMQDWNTADIEDGIYTISLEVEDQFDQISANRQGIEIANVHLMHPQNNDVIRAGDWVDIIGSVYGKSRTYILEYGLGVQPSQWISVGIHQSVMTAGSAHKTILARWDTSLMEANQIYSLRLRATDGSGEFKEDFVQGILLDGSLREGFPILQEVGREMPAQDWRIPVVADLDQDGFEEIVTVDAGDLFGRESYLNVFRHDGSLLWQRELGSAVPFDDLPLVGDLNGDGKMEIFTEGGSGGALRVFSHDGQPWGAPWPLHLNAKSLGKVMADLDLDGQPELILLSHQSPDGGFQATQRLWLLRADGSIWMSWSLGSCEYEADAMELLPVVANMDEDPQLEIIIRGGCQNFLLFDLDTPGRPLRSGRIWEGKVIASPVVGDLDQDGWNEVILLSTGKETESRGGIWVLDHNLELLPGFPVLQDEHFQASPALADMDGDGDLEIVAASVHSRSLHLIHHHGFEAVGWPVGPVQDGHLNSSPVVADMDGDSHPDIVMAVPGFSLITLITGSSDHTPGIRAWNALGQPLSMPGSPSGERLWMESAGGGLLKAAPPVLTDLDHDGLLDVVATSILDLRFAYENPRTSLKHRNSVYAWSLPVPFDVDAAPWPRYQKDLGRSGRYAAVDRLNQPPIIHRILSQTIPTGETFFPVNLRPYASDPDHERHTLVWQVTGEGGLILELSDEDILRVSPPDPTWSGSEWLHFLVTDPGGEQARLTARFSVLEGYQPPEAQTDKAITLEDTPHKLDLLANDRHPAGLPLTIMEVLPPLHGRSVMLEDGGVTYLPDEHFHGDDSFDYVITDDQGGMAMGRVLMEVVPVEDEPEAQEDRIIVIEDELIAFDPMINDVDPDNEPIKLVEWSLPEHGELVPIEAGGFEYQPAPDYFGTDAFSYVIEDSSGLQATGHVQLLVKGINDPPEARKQQLSMSRNRELNITFSAVDPDRDPLTYEIVEGPEHGTLMAFPQVATYRPEFGFSGTDAFSYRANDGRVDGPIGWVNIVVSDVNNPPDMREVNLVTALDQKVIIPLQAEDVDEDPVSYEIFKQPEAGLLSWKEGVLTYMPPPRFLGETAGMLRISDDQGGQRLVGVNLVVTDQNTPPVVRDSAVDIFGHQSMEFLLDAKDPENNPLTFEWIVLPENGSLTGEAPELTYHPADGFYGFDRIQFRASDGELESELATVVIEVQHPNHPPTSHDQSLLIASNKSHSFSLDVEDEDQDVLQRVILEGPGHGVIAGQGKELTYTPQSGYVGSDSFTWRAWDGFKYSPVAKVQIRIARYDPSFVLRIEKVTLSPEANVLIEVRGEPGRAYMLQASSDFVVWDEVDQQVSGSEIMRMQGGQAHGLGHLFYRVVLVP